MKSTVRQNVLSRSRAVFAAAAICCVAFSATSVAHAQAQVEESPSQSLVPVPSTTETANSLPDAPQPHVDGPSLVGTPKRIGQDLIGLVTFPGRIRASDAKWLLPLTAATVASFALDEKTMSEVVTRNPATNQTSANVSDGLRDGFIATPIVMYAAGLAKHDDHLRETGLLGGEAMTDAYIAGDLIKLVSFRERPNVDRSEGSFYRTSAGYDSSFISGHSLTAWSSAAVIASEYPNKWVQISAYTAASGVSLTRVLAQQHFPSDVLLGSAAGWLIGRYVYHRHSRHYALTVLPSTR